MNRTVFTLALGLVASVATSAAADVTVDFEGIGDGAFVNEYYYGGQASNGTRGSFSTGVQFVNFRTVSRTTAYPSTTFAFNAASPALFNTQAQFYGLSFDYRFTDTGTFEIWSDMGATGTLLQSTSFAANALEAAAPFQRGSISFAGIGRSIRLTGTNGRLALDNITFATNPVPEPTSWALMIAGIGAIGVATRRRVQVRTTASYA